MPSLDNDDFALFPGSWAGDIRPSLFLILKRNTGSGKTEVHILSAASGHKQFVLQVPTALGPTDASWTFRLADWDGDGIPDLWAIRTNGAAKTEVHILSGASNFSKFILQTPTALDTFTGGQFDFDVIKPFSAPQPNLVAFKRVGTGTNSTELHVLSGASNFQQFTHQVGTGLHETPLAEEWTFRMTDFDKNGVYDMCVISPANGGELHVFSGPEFRSAIAHTPIKQADVDSGQAETFFGFTDDQWSIAKSCGSAIISRATASSFLAILGAFIGALDCFHNIVKYNRTLGKPQPSDTPGTGHTPGINSTDPGGNTPTPTMTPTTRIDHLDIKDALLHPIR